MLPWRKGNDITRNHLSENKNEVKGVLDFFLIFPNEKTGKLTDTEGTQRNNNVKTRLNYYYVTVKLNWL